jgi:hypothetical protein
MDKDMQPEMTTDDEGNKFWWLNNRIHREDGPAIEFADGSKEWYLNGEHHRTDGPAVEYADGHKEWWLDGYWISFEGWLKQATGLTDEEKVMFKLKYG